MDVVRACAGRAGVGAWRSRRQVVWGVCVLITVGIVYIQYAPSVSVDQHSGPRHRALNTVYKEDEESNQKSQPQKQIQKVKFVTDSDNQNEENWAHAQDRDHDHEKSAAELSKDWLPQNDGASVELEKTAPPDPNYAQHNAAVELLNKRVVEQVHNDQNQGEQMTNFGMVVPQQQEVVNSNSGWGNSQYRYNPYGEPVYGQTNRPNYIPGHRLVHFDLKGAPPKISVIKKLIPWLVANGATAVLLEYEDMFPWTGRLAPIAAGNHYTHAEITDLVNECRTHGLEVIPLVQTFGHLEYALKLERFSHLREVPEIPSALCPSLNESLWLVRKMVDQIMLLHPGSKFLHIGCDEVNQLGECEKCRMMVRETLFMQHVSAVAKYVRNKHKVIPIVWDDMLRHVSESTMQEFNLGELVEPMVWVYAEDIYRFVQPSVWTKFGQIFPRVWAASAFKGAFGEQLTVPNVRRHLDNNLNWLDVMAGEHNKFKGGFRGLCITGWQRYDHFAVLAELLPAAIPSLAVNLIATSHGYFNTSLQNQLYQSLNCMQTPKYQTWLNLDVDPFLWEKFSWCFFPGAGVFKVTARLDATRKDVDAYIERVTRSRGWITEYNRRHNYSLPTRVDEDLEELPARLHSVTMLMKTAREALGEWFDDWTTGEWLEQRIWPMMQSLQKLQKESENMKLVHNWKARPLPLLPELSAFGVSDPSNHKEQNDRDNPNLNFGYNQN